MILDHSPGIVLHFENVLNLNNSLNILKQPNLRGSHFEANILDFNVPEPASMAYIQRHKSLTTFFLFFPGLCDCVCKQDVAACR